MTSSTPTRPEDENVPEASERIELAPGERRTLRLIIDVDKEIRESTSVIKGIAIGVAIACLVFWVPAAVLIAIVLTR